MAIPGEAFAAVEKHENLTSEIKHLDWLVKSLVDPYPELKRVHEITTLATVLGKKVHREGNEGILRVLKGLRDRVVEERDALTI